MEDSTETNEADNLKDKPKPPDESHKMETQVVEPKPPTNVVPKKPFITFEDGRPTDYVKHGMNRPPSYVPEKVNTTPMEALLFTPAETEEKIAAIRDAVENSPEIIELRNKFIQASRYPLVEVDGEMCIPLYRGLASKWEEASTAAGLTTYGKSPDSKLIYEKDYWIALEEYRQGIITGEKLLKTILKSHIVDSSYSLFIPATTSIDYGSNVHPKTEQVLELLVPLKYVVPITYLRQRWNWGHQGFDTEQEVGIAGRIEPKWVRIVKLDNKTQ